MKVVKLPQPGGCVCGAVRYELNAAPLLAFACHCRDCQTRSGSAFSLTIVARTADIVISGAPEMQAQATSSGRQIEHISCPTCRVRTLARAIVAPEFMSVRAGTLDDASWVVPIVQTFVDRAIPWAVIPDVRSASWDKFDYVALGLEWKASAPAFAKS